MVAAKIESFRHGGDRGNQYAGGKMPIGILPRKQVAKMMNVGATSVARASAIQDHGISELQAAVAAGKVSAWSAVRERAPQDHPKAACHHAVLPAKGDGPRWALLEPWRHECGTEDAANVRAVRARLFDEIDALRDGRSTPQRADAAARDAKNALKAARANVKVVKRGRK